MNDSTQVEATDRKDNRILTVLAGFRDWIDDRLPIVAAW